MKVAIIGAGIVGSTAAHYLSKEAQVDVTVYDHGVGQATKGRAGIISPWFSKRRNKAWYRPARSADFYQELVEGPTRTELKQILPADRRLSPQEKGEDKLDDLYLLALSRREESPLIGDLAILNKEEVGQQFPGLKALNSSFMPQVEPHVEGSSSDRNSSEGKWRTSDPERGCFG